MVRLKVILILVAALSVFFSGCTSGQDVTPMVKALPEVQVFLKEHPNAKITVTYLSKEEVEKFAQEISQQCDKPVTSAAMYKAVISEGELKSIVWIDAATQTLVCVIIEGKGIVPAPTQTATYIPAVTTQVITQTSTPTPTPTPTSTPTPASTTPVPTTTLTSLPSSKTMTVGETWNPANGYTLTILSIDEKASPRKVWIDFSSKYGRDSKVINEGDTYTYDTFTYGTIFSTNIASIYNSGGMPYVRFDNTAFLQ